MRQRVAVFGLLASSAVATALACCLGDPYEVGVTTSGTGTVATGGTSQGGSSSSSTSSGGSGAAPGGGGAAVGGSGGEGGTLVGTCANFNPNFVAAAECSTLLADGGIGYLPLYQSSFVSMPEFLILDGNCDADVTITQTGHLRLVDCDGAGPEQPYPRTPIGAMRGCVVGVTIDEPVPPDAGMHTEQAAFTMRRTGAGGSGGCDKPGTIQVGVMRESGDVYRIRVWRYDYVAPATECNQLLLGSRGDYSLPLELFIANDGVGRVCAGAVLDGQYDCVACSEADADTDAALDESFLLLTSKDSFAEFDNLNL